MFTVPTHSYSTFNSTRTWTVNLRDNEIYRSNTISPRTNRHAQSFVTSSRMRNRASYSRRNIVNAVPMKRMGRYKRSFKGSLVSCIGWEQLCHRYGILRFDGKIWHHNTEMLEPCLVNAIL